jgi:hypothetical protein
MVDEHCNCCGASVVKNGLFIGAMHEVECYIHYRTDSYEIILCKSCKQKAVNSGVLTENEYFRFRRGVKANLL